MKAYHATTVDKLEKMENNRVGIGSKPAFFSTDLRHTYSFAWKRMVGRGRIPVILEVDIDPAKADNYHRCFWKTQERPLIQSMIKPFGSAMLSKDKT